MSALEIYRGGKSLAILEEDEETNVGKTGITVFWCGGISGIVYVHSNRYNDYFELELVDPEEERILHLDSTGPSIDIYTRDRSPKPTQFDILLKKI
ncbi:hypothetical protein A2771_00540 [Candidatus Woesebacteria bacterium RIFCSPHIGHO2_01_FULL_38_26b]|uniref:Uncharacterized protein n=1 Tax=Candidatus Woesebacteria bacterium RIFCSPHIGHO2_01_FULL_38_26b TaxID=1802491 RepID=A0A1F7XZN4_9BACT|nr:MAG: hypothetical protein A2771_00540 [Candidatus Woesebacteria bacterium RIFCSPHIGHO2_01_FULL_38_26b]